MSSNGHKSLSGPIYCSNFFCIMIYVPRSYVQNLVNCPACRGLFHTKWDHLWWNTRHLHHLFRQLSAEVIVMSYMTLFVRLTLSWSCLGHLSKFWQWKWSRRPRRASVLFISSVALTRCCNFPRGKFLSWWTWAVTFNYSLKSLLSGFLLIFIW